MHLDLHVIVLGWYIGHGHDQKAREILAKYHSQGDQHSAIVELQMKEMKEVIDVENGTDKRQVDLRAVYRMTILTYRQVVGYPRSVEDEVRQAPFLPCHLHRFLRSMGSPANQLLLPAHGMLHSLLNSRYS